MDSYLKQFIQYVENADMWDAFYITDTAFVGVARTDNFCGYLGCDPIGLRLRQLDSPLTKFGSNILEHDEKFLNSSTKNKKVIAKIQHDTYFDFFDMRIVKIINPQNQQLVGIGYFCNKIEISPSLLAMFNRTQHQFYSFYQPSELPQQISTLEHDIIWLLAAGKSQKQIADVISSLEQQRYDRNRIAAIINRSIYRKFEVNTLDKLLAKLGGSELMATISTRLFQLLAKPQ